MADRGYRGRPQRGERADRQINAGHSRGLDAALSDTEAKIRKLKTERIYAFDQNGKEISHSTRGTSTSTKLPSGYNYKDAILTHNHPGEGLDSNIAGRIGRSFSSADIATTVIKKRIRDKSYHRLLYILYEKTEEWLGNKYATSSRECCKKDKG